MPTDKQSQEKIKVQAEKVYGTDTTESKNSQALNDFTADSVPGPPSTLLNLSIPLIDALQVEFGLVENLEVFLEA